MRLIKHRQAGFTIIELMVATAIFSVVLVIVTTGVISFSRSYYHGIINNNTQNLTRNAVNDITQNIQFSSGQLSTITANGESKGYCINQRPYYYILGRQVIGSDSADATNHGLVTTDGACSDPVPNLINLNFDDIKDSNPKELLGKNLRLTSFDVSQITESLFTVTLKVAYGDADLLCSFSAGSCRTNPSPTELSSPNVVSCRSDAGSQYCTVAGLTANVAKRL